MQSSNPASSGQGGDGKGGRSGVRWLFFWRPRRAKPPTSATRNPRVGAGPSMSDWTHAMTRPGEPPER